MGWPIVFGWVVFGVCVIVVFAVVGWINLYMKSRYGEGRDMPAKEDEFQMRLDEMDKRLHDILDVMIALSEKFDRWEAEQSDREEAVRG